MKTVPWYKRVGPWIGIGTGPGVLMVGGGLADRLSLPLLLIAILCGAAVMVLLAVAQGLFSRHRREPVPVRAGETFGAAVGGHLLNLIMALGMVGWVSFYVSLVGFSWSAYFDWPVWLGALLMAAGLFGLNLLGIDRWNLLVLITAVSTLGVALFTLLVAEGAPAESTAAGTGLAQLFWGMGSVIAYGGLFATRAGDFTWDLETDVDVWKSGLGLLIPLLIFLAIGVFAYRTIGDWNLADILTQTRSPLVGNLFLLLASVANVLSAFHSGSLAIKGLGFLSRRQGAAIIAAISFVIGATRFDRQLLLFLDLVGAVVPSALVVMLVVALLARKPKPAAALLAWGAGAGTALLLKAQGYLFHMFAGVLVSLIVLALGALWWQRAYQKAESQVQ